MQSVAWNAQDYARHSSQQQIWARELIAKLHLRGDERVLDIGSGDGKVTAEIAAALPRGSVLGVDSSPQMVALAQRTFPPHLHINLRFAQHDARSLPFHNEFDIVFSSATLHWVRDQEPVVRGIAHGLRPGGRILLQMGGQGNVAAVAAVLDRLVAAPRWAEYFRDLVLPFGFFGPQEYSGWLHAAGLTALRVELFPRDVWHDGMEAFAGWSRSTHLLPYQQCLPEHERQLFCDEFVVAYIAAHPPDAQGRVHVRMVRLEVEARK